MTLLAHPLMCGLSAGRFPLSPRAWRAKKPSVSSMSVSATPANPPPICQSASRRVCPQGNMTVPLDCRLSLRERAFFRGAKDDSQSIDVNELIRVEQHVTQRCQGEGSLLQ